MRPLVSFPQGEMSLFFADDCLRNRATVVLVLVSSTREARDLLTPLPPSFFSFFHFNLYVTASRKISPFAGLSQVKKACILIYEKATKRNQRFLFWGQVPRQRHSSGRSCTTLRTWISTPLPLPPVIPLSSSLPSTHVPIVIASLSPVPNPLPLQRAAHPHVKRRCLWPDETSTSYVIGHDLCSSSRTCIEHRCTTWFFL